MLLVSLDHQNSIMAAESKGVAERNINFFLPGFVWYVIEVAFGIGCFVMYCRGQDASLNSLDTEDRLKGACRTHHVASHGFGRGHGNFVCHLPQSCFQCFCLRKI